MHQLVQDARHTVRMLLKQPRFTAAAIGCIAAGLASSVFIMAIAHSLLRRDLPFEDADRLVRIWAVDANGNTRGDLSWPDVQEIAARSRTLDGIEVAARTRAAVVTRDGSERLRGESVSVGYFARVGITPALGRRFETAEYGASATPVVIIGHDLWQRQFSGRTDVLGQPLVLRGAVGMDIDRIATIVGVMPPGFIGTVDPDIAEFWLPLQQYVPRPLLSRRETRMVWTLARLRRVDGLEAANTELAAVSAAMRAEFPGEYANIEFRAEPVGAAARAQFRPALILLMAGSALLLLIACGNLTSMLLARTAQRAPELHMRMALGAGRSRIAFHLLMESLFLAAAGGVLGTATAATAVRAADTTSLFPLPGYMSLALSLDTVAIAVALVLAAALIVGLAPAAIGMRAGMSSHVRTLTPSRQQNRMSDALVVAQVALAVVLLSGTALLLRSYGNLVKADTGFRTANIARLAISLDPAQFPDAHAQLQFAREADARLEAVPGVRKATMMAGVLPPWFDRDVTLTTGGDTTHIGGIEQHAVDEDFFTVLDISIVNGRGIEFGDAAQAEPVAILSAALAAVLHNGDTQRALDTHVQVGETTRRVVGIAEDVLYHGPRQDRPQYDIYVPLAQSVDEVISIAVHTTKDALALIIPLQRVLGSRAPTSPQHWVSTMEAELAGRFQDARVNAWLAAVFGGSALLVTLFGIYGVLTHAVARRSRELSVRKALGALGVNNLLLVLSHAGRLIILGIAIGFGIAIACAGYAHSLVFGVSALDAPSFLAAAGLILVAGMFMAAAPAMRAGAADPAAVLRS